MQSATEAFGALFQSNVEALQRSTEFALSGCEQLLKLQFDSAQKRLQRRSRQALSLLDQRDWSAAVKDWQAMVEDGLQCNAELARDWLEAVAGLQSEFARLAQQQIPTFNQQFAAGMKELAQSVPALVAGAAAQQEARTRKAA